jgi:hypothetical protein
VILTIDLMLLKPYFHGTTRRTGAPSWLRQRLAVHADAEQRQRVHGLIEAQALDIGERDAGQLGARQGIWRRS